MKRYKVELQHVVQPEKDCTRVPVMLSDETIRERKENVLRKMKERNLDQLIIYGDVEHGGNFEYLIGYFTRFEEALLIIDACGEMRLVLGNENLNKAAKARCEAAAVHASIFSLPNQPNSDKSMESILAEAGIEKGKRTGLVGWKLFTGPKENNKKIYDLPSYIVDAIRTLVGNEALLSNETDLFIGEEGARTINNANEIAHYEYGAALASDCVLDAMNSITEGMPETKLGDTLVRDGQHTSIVTIAASGPRFIKGNMFPTNNEVKVGDTVSLTVGYRGGSSSRAAYAVHDVTELPETARDYLDRVAKPYFEAYVCWLEEIHIGMKGGALFEKIEAILPRSQYGWHLCPGHLTAEEEWMSSPIYEKSKECLQSGMMLQIDIIPSVSGYGGVSAESTVVLADEKLKAEIRRQYPEMWERMQKRRAYIETVLGIQLSADVLPMCSTVAYMRPYLLDKEAALVIRETCNE